MNKTMQLIFTVLVTFTVMFLTSLLLDLSWVAAHWIRECLIISLIAVELVHGVILYKEIATN